MAATATATSTFTGSHPGEVNTYTVAIVCSSGAANVAIKDAAGNSLKFNGTLLQAAFTKGTIVAGALTLVDGSSRDVLGGLGADVSSDFSDTPLTTNGIPFILMDTNLNVVISGASGAATATLVFAVR